MNKYQPLTSSLEILEEIKKILAEPEIDYNNCNIIPININENYISIYDVYELIYKTKKNYDTMKRNYENKIELSVKNNFGDDAKIILYGFSTSKGGIDIDFKRYSFSEDNNIIFSKLNEDVYIKYSETSIYQFELLKALGNIILTAYDDFLKFEAFNNETKYNINAINTNLLVDISKDGVSIDNSEGFNASFKLKLASSDNEFDYTCNSSNVLNVISGHEQEIFRKILIKISDCPNWMKDELYKIRKQEIENFKKEKLKSETEQKEQLNPETEQKEQLNKNDKKIRFKNKILSLFKHK